MKKIIYGLLLAFILGSVFTSCASKPAGKASVSAETGTSNQVTEKNAK